MKYEPCPVQDKECFARMRGQCRILEDIRYYKNCNFCKPKMEVTKGKIYLPGKEPEEYYGDDESL